MSDTAPPLPEAVAATAKPGRSIDRIRDLMQILRIEAAN